MKNTLIILLFTSVLVNLAACSVAPIGAGNTAVGSANTVNSSSADIRQANQLLRQGKKLEAASAYYQASRNQASPQRERLVLQAAEIATYVKDKSLARHYLSKVNPAQLSSENRARRSYVLALVAILDNNYRAALNTLPAQRGSISTELWNKIQQVRQQASSQATRGANTGTTGSVAIPQHINQVAVLLPLSGKLGTLGNIILKGIQSSTQIEAPDIQIRTYDVASADILTQYKRAVDEGANVIIGPLDKRKLSILAKQGSQLARPVISLNHLNPGQGSAPTALYQYGLAPEDEARQVAGFAASRGQRRATVLYPDSQWGRRLSDAFKQMYTAQGGQIVSESSYPASTSASYKPAVKQALAAGVNNIDMVFLAAAPTQARIIRPMIQHLHGENIPVYATSHIYSGQPDAGKNIDLDGIIYTEIPYIIEGSQLNAITPSTGKYPRLFAMGADALLIAKDLNAMARGKTLQGKTGSIRVGGNRFLQRKLALATFVNGLTTYYGE